jgi:hypothetical protein
MGVRCGLGVAGSPSRVTILQGLVGKFSISAYPYPSLLDFARSDVIPSNVEG